MDGIPGDRNIANLFASKFEGVLNRNSNTSLTYLHSPSLPSVSDPLLRDVFFSEDDVLEVVLQLKPRKYDASGVCSEHIKFASSVISQPLAAFFTSVVRHGYIYASLHS